MKVSGLLHQLLICRDFTMSNPRQAYWTLGTVTLEAVARLQGYYDYWHKHEHHIWQMVDSTKALETGQHKVRHLCNAQSVLVFRLFFEGNNAYNDAYNAMPEREAREITEVARRLLSTLRTKLRKEDKISINGPGIITVVIRSEQAGAEIVAKRIQEIAQATSVRSRWRGKEIKVRVAYSSLTFASKPQNGTMTVSCPLMDESITTAVTVNAR
ncbi:MAG TPA: hypothetical protein DHW02_03600 [Ktedonobacter sp.]|nr:hypothetical protein [Ktedonobacter sp.]